MQADVYFPLTELKFILSFTVKNHGFYQTLDDQGKNHGLNLARFKP